MRLPSVQAHLVRYYRYYMKRLSGVFLAVLLAAPLLFSQNPAPTQSPSSDTVVEEIVARVNNSIVTRADMRKAREQLTAEANQPDRGAGDQDAKEREKDLLRDLIDQQLLLQKAQDLGISADTELVKRLDELRKQMHAESMEDLEKAAQAQGISFEDFKQNMKNNILTQRVIGQEVGGHITVTSQEIQQYYDRTRPNWSVPSRCV